MDTPPTGLVQENVLGNMESVMVEMIVLTALMKDKIFVVSGQNLGWTQCLVFSKSRNKGHKEERWGKTVLLQHCKPIPVMKTGFSL